MQQSLSFIQLLVLMERFLIRRLEIVGGIRKMRLKNFESRDVSISVKMVVANLQQLGIFQK